MSSSRPPSASKATNISTGSRTTSASSRLRAAQTNLSFEVNAEQKAQDRLQAQSDDEREQFIIDVFHKTFGDAIRNNSDAFRGRFRKMAENPFNFYRGSAVLFYHDLKIDQDPWIARNNSAGNIFIHGDLHAENFGTYMNSDGILNFDVNDFDEGYFGPFTWDVKRLLASLNIVAYAKGFSKDIISKILTTCADAYVKQVYKFCDSSKDQLAFTSENTTGKIQLLLNEARIQSHVNNLAKMTVIKDYGRKFNREDYQDVNSQLYKDITNAFNTTYRESIPKSKENKGSPSSRSISYKIKDIVQCPSRGIGSAGAASYSILVEGLTEALENDVVLSMKQAIPSAVSSVVKNPELEKIGYGKKCDTIIPQISQSNYSTHFIFNVAKIHCVADSDCINLLKNAYDPPSSIIPHDTDAAIRDAIGKQDKEFIEDMVNFGMTYGEQVRRDHRIFHKALVEDRIPGLKKEEYSD
ncbi:unnamed protein product [Rotaria sp. Silwood1]|nr:unnamed protein product [Rotaria sp. Silwood1]